MLDSPIGQVCTGYRRVLNVGVGDATVRLSKKHLGVVQALLTLDLLLDELQGIEI